MRIAAPAWKGLAVGGACPTFSWALADEAKSYELSVLDLAEPERPQPVLERRFAEGISRWTPSGEWKNA